MESAIYHACVNANVVSLHAIETGVSSLRQRFDQDADSVSDADIFSLVDTIERAKIPTISQISALNNDTNIADRVVSFLWKNILEKPSVFPSDWGMLANKPTTFPPATHTHEAQAVAVAWTDVTDKPATFPPVEHTHEAQAVAVAWTDVTDKPATFPPVEHTHEAQADSTPAGSMIMFGGAVAPTGWLFCDGAAVSRETYAALFAAIGVVWGAGDGSTTFNLPDARGRSAMGAGQGSGLTARTLGATLGEEAHALTANENGAHTHNSPSGFSGGPGGDHAGGAPSFYAHKTASSGLGTPHNTVHPVFVCHYIIKF